MGVERFWPTSNDFREELEKCERILRTFTVEGLPTEETVADGKKKRKVYRKIPPKGKGTLRSLSNLFEQLLQSYRMPRESSFSSGSVE